MMAAWRSNNATVCKTVIRGCNSHRRLKFRRGVGENGRGENFTLIMCLPFGRME